MASHPLFKFDNDNKQAAISVLLLLVMSAVIVGMIVAAVLSTRACSV